MAKDDLCRSVNGECLEFRCSSEWYGSMRALILHSGGGI